MPRGVYKRPTNEDKLSAFVDKVNGPVHPKLGRCWVWVGYKVPGGYGLVRTNKKPHLVHRLSYQAAVGTIPEGLKVLHKCDNPPCLRPSHLFVGDTQANSDDMVRKGRNPRGESVKSSKLTKEQVLFCRKHYKARSKTYGSRALGKRFKVNPSTIERAVSGERWAHL